jgi:hypothetical protein
VVPQVTDENNRCLIARQLTLFYRLLPHLCRIRAKAYPHSVTENSCQTAVIQALAKPFYASISKPYANDRTNLGASAKKPRRFTPGLCFAAKVVTNFR